MGAEEMGGKAMGAKETGGNAKGTNASGVKTTRAQDSQETGGKGHMLIGKREMDSMLAGDTTAGQNAIEVIRHKSFSEVA